MFINSEGILFSSTNTSFDLPHQPPAAGHLAVETCEEQFLSQYTTD
jgi:hypothetical protein